MRVLDRLEAEGFNVFRARPTVGWMDAPPIALRAMFWRKS